MAKQQTKKKAERDAEGRIVITPPMFEYVSVRIVGVAPYVQNRLSNKVKEEIVAKQQLTKAEQNAIKRKRDPRNLKREFEAAQHFAKSRPKWVGIPCAAFRNAMIDATRQTGVTMTEAKMTVVVMAEGYDAVENSALVRIQGKPEMCIVPARIPKQNVTHFPVRPMWKEWSCNLTIRFDAEQFTLDSIINLLQRAGTHVGVGEGRPLSKNSGGCGWGVFEVDFRSIKHMRAKVGSKASARRYK